MFAHPIYPLCMLSELTDQFPGNQKITLIVNTANFRLYSFVFIFLDYTCFSLPSVMFTKLLLSVLISQRYAFCLPQEYTCLLLSR